MKQFAVHAACERRLEHAACGVNPKSAPGSRTLVVAFLPVVCISDCHCYERVNLKAMRSGNREWWERVALATHGCFEPRLRALGRRPSLQKAEGIRS